MLQNEDGIVGALKESPVEHLALSDRLFGRFPFADVNSNARQVHLAVEDEPDAREIERNRRPVLGDQRGLRIRVTVGEHSCHSGRDVSDVFSAKPVADVHVSQLVRGVARHLLLFLIPPNETAFRVEQVRDPRDAIQYGVRKDPFSLQRFFGPPPRGDVREDSQDARNIAVFVFDGGLQGANDRFLLGGR